MTRVLVTGATGFIGTALCPALEQAGFTVRAAVRSPRELPYDTAVVGPVSLDTVWGHALCNVDVVIHLAGVAHIKASRQAYNDTNHLGTDTLIRAAERAGVKRFIFASSIAVQGPLCDCTSDHWICPHNDPYAKSKELAERGCHGDLLFHDGELQMQCAIVRPPLVYGPGVRAKFLKLMQLIDRGVPLPFGAINNARSYVGIRTLCDLFTTLVTHPRPRGTWMVSDGEDLSTPDLIRRVAKAMQKPARLIDVPRAILKAGATLAMRGKLFASVCDSVIADISKTRDVLGWVPRPMDEELERTAHWFRAQS